MSEQQQQQQQQQKEQQQVVASTITVARWSPELWESGRSSSSSLAARAGGGGGRGLLGVCGLYNLGNTCYLNATLQALASCAPIAAMATMRQTETVFLLPPLQPNGTRSQAQAKRALFSKHFFDLMAKMWLGREKALSPVQVARSVIETVPEFDSYGQQDAQEALNYILNNLHEEMCAPVSPECHPAREMLLLFEQEQIQLYHRCKQMIADRSKGIDPSTPAATAAAAAAVAAANATKLPNKQKSGRGGRMLGSRRRGTNGGTNGVSMTKSTDSPLPPSASASTSSITSPSTEEEETTDEGGGGGDDGKPPRLRQVHDSYEQSIVSDTFSTFLAQRIVCLNCGCTSQMLEEYLELSLALPNKSQMKEMKQSTNGQDDGDGSSNGNGTWGAFKNFFGSIVTLGGNSSSTLSLDDCLRAFFSKEKLDGTNQYFCDVCKSKQDALKSVSLAHLPQIFCIQLKRFNKMSGWGLGNAKNCTMVSFPITGLDLGSYLHESTTKATNTSTLYDLFAVVRHGGGVDHGHYVATCKNAVDGFWYEYDDELIRKISEDSLLTSDVYLLLYTKRATPAQAERKKLLQDHLADTQKREQEKQVYYISNYWSMQWNSLVNPGPVSNAFLVCEHGDLLCTVQEDYNRRLLSLSQSTWDLVTKHYGTLTGSRPLNRLQVCEQCLDKAERLNQRREEEGKVVTELDAIPANQVWCILSTAWLKKWHAFIGNDVGPVGRGTWLGCPPPGPITNETLFQSDGKQLKENLKKAFHYRGVNKPVWDYFVKIYGGGPEIIRKQIEIYETVTPS